MLERFSFCRLSPGTAPLPSKEELLSIEVSGLVHCSEYQPPSPPATVPVTQRLTVQPTAVTSKRGGQSMHTTVLTGERGGPSTQTTNNSALYSLYLYLFIFIYMYILLIFIIVYYFLTNSLRGNKT